VTWATVEGLPFPLGISWCETDRAYNFALYSKHATSVRLLLFEKRELAIPHVEIVLDPFINKSGRVWHCRVPEAIVGSSRYYGYVVEGPDPTGPFEVHAFHREKLLLDPYARCIAFPPSFDRSSATDRYVIICRASGSSDGADSAGSNCSGAARYSRNAANSLLMCQPSA